MKSRLAQIGFNKGLATLAQSVLVGSKYAPLDALKIGLCVSGGPDSMALACRVASLKERDLGFEINPIAFVIDHNARPEAGTEAKAVTRLLSKLGIPSHIAKIQWDHPDPLQLPNFEGKARQHRYRLLTKLALDHGVRHLFLGHHRDDQVETVILRMIRNQSLSSMDLRGMESIAPVPVPYSIYGARHENPPVSIRSLIQDFTSESWKPSDLSKTSLGDINRPEYLNIDDGEGRIKSYSPGGIMVHRPFLNLTKDELVATCNSRKVQFVTDRTNEDSQFTIRNAVRMLRTHHKLPRALQPDALLDLARSSRQAFRFLQAEVMAYMSSVKIVFFNFRSGVVYIRLPRSFVELATERQPVAAGVLSQLCQLVSPNPTESFRTMVEPRRLKEFVNSLQSSSFWNAPSRTKAPVFVYSRVVFEGFVANSDDGTEDFQSPDSYGWKLSRQPLRPAEVEPVNVALDLSSTNHLGSSTCSSQRILWDNRFWIRVTCSDCRLFEDMTLRPFRLDDWRSLTEQLHPRVMKTIRAAMNDHAPGNSRYTLPALCFRDRVVALPTLADDIFYTKSLKAWLRQQSNDLPFRLEWDVEYKVLPTSILCRV